MSEEEVLIIMAKNPVKGSVKTRLANEIGELPALKIYEELFSQTLKTAASIPVKKHIYFSDFIENELNVNNASFHIQNGSDLGKRMAHAAKNAFDEGVQSIVIIGTDCNELTSLIVKTAFDSLKNKDVVLGPSEDGGYYLIGMTAFIPELFENVNWGSNEVLEQSLSHLKTLSLSVEMLEELNDIDTLEDFNRNKDLSKRFGHLILKP